MKECHDVHHPVVLVLKHVVFIVASVLQLYQQKMQDVLHCVVTLNNTYDTKNARCVVTLNNTYDTKNARCVVTLNNTYDTKKCKMCCDTK